MLVLYSNSVSQKLYTTSDIYLNFSFHCISECPTSGIGQNTSDIYDVFGVFGLHCSNFTLSSTVAVAACGIDIVQKGLGDHFLITCQSKF